MRYYFLADAQQPRNRAGHWQMIEILIVDDGYVTIGAKRKKEGGLPLGPRKGKCSKWTEYLVLRGGVQNLRKNLPFIGPSDYTQVSPRLRGRGHPCRVTARGRLLCDCHAALFGV